MEGRHPKVLALGGNVLRGKHGGVGGRLVTVSLDLHSARDSDESLASGKVRDMDERVVERREKVGHGEHLLALNQVVRVARCWCFTVLAQKIMSK